MSSSHQMEIKGLRQDSCNGIRFAKLCFIASTTINNPFACILTHSVSLIVAIQPRINTDAGYKMNHESCILPHVFSG
jgi:hypothetical protein